MLHQKRNRALTLAVLALGFCGASPALAAVTPGGDTTVAASSSQDTIVGSTGIGTLGIDGGSVLSDRGGSLGQNAGSAGTATISGEGSKWTKSGNLTVGSFGSGILNIEASGYVGNVHGYIGFHPESAGAVTVSGTGSTWNSTGNLVAGFYGVGTLRIETGGRVNSNSGVLGEITGSMGTVTVTGAGSTWTNAHDLKVGGYSGSGALTVTDGGLVTAQTLYASLSNIHGNGTIAANGVILDADLVFNSTQGITQTLAFGAGGALNLAINGSGELGVGYGRNSGSLSIMDDVAVASTRGYVGYGAGSSGTATVSGTGSAWNNSGDLSIGYYGSGTININAGAQVNNRNGYVGHLSASSSGAVTVSGAESKWTNSGDLFIGYSGSGTLTVADGGLVTATTLYASLSDLHGNGTITANGAVLDTDLVFDGTQGTIRTLPFGSGGSLTFTTNGGKLGVGHKGTGSLHIKDGTAVASSGGYLGHRAGSVGTATVTGTGSTWVNSNELRVGDFGSGTLTITGGAQVSDLFGYVGSGTGSIGIATVRGAGSKWSHGNKLEVGMNGHGDLIVEEGGQLSSETSYLGRASGAAGTVTVTGAGSKWTSKEIYLAHSGIGTLNIETGGWVSSDYGYLGYHAYGYLGNNQEPIGIARVSGAGSKWTNGNDLHVGRSGTGMLSINAGGLVTTGNAVLGFNNGSTGTAVVSGVGSKWTAAALLVGSSGNGLLTVADGGLVSARTLSVNSQSAVHLRVSGNDMLVLGSSSGNGSLTNNGTIALIAEASLPAGTYRPITPYPNRAINWSGTGSYKAFGGVWDTALKTFTVTELTALDAGQSSTLTTGERLLFTDSLTGHRVGASFGAITGSVNFSAAPMGAADLADLAVLLDDGQGAISAWAFTTNFTGGEALLSFDIGPGAEDLSVWHYSNGVWSAYTPTLFTYDANGLASFTVNSFSGYALTAAVPEPASLGLLAFIALPLLRRQRKSASA